MQYLTPDYHGKGEDEAAGATLTYSIVLWTTNTHSLHSETQQKVLPLLKVGPAGCGVLQEQWVVVMVVHSNSFKLITNTFPPGPRGIWWTGLPHIFLRLYCYFGILLPLLLPELFLLLTAPPAGEISVLCVCISQCVCDQCASACVIFLLTHLTAVAWVTRSWVRGHSHPHHHPAELQPTHGVWAALGARMHNPGASVTSQMGCVWPMHRR